MQVVHVVKQDSRATRRATRLGPHRCTRPKGTGLLRLQVPNVPCRLSQELARAAPRCRAHRSTAVSCLSPQGRPRPISPGAPRRDAQSGQSDQARTVPPADPGTRPRTARSCAVAWAPHHLLRHFDPHPFCPHRARSAAESHRTSSLPRLTLVASTLRVQSTHIIRKINTTSCICS